jgi:transcriptional regulator of acetoin/glycerol metabolism
MVSLSTGGARLATIPPLTAWGLWTGAVWSEKSEGTNGIGTCLVEQRALTIDRDQHFFARNALLSCTTAPIFDEHGELAAAIDVSSCQADLTEGFQRLTGMVVADAARTIEVENFRLAFPQARILVTAAGERAGAALLAVDSDDLVIGATSDARLTLGLNAQRLARPIPAADLIGKARSEGDGVGAAERAALHRALARGRQRFQGGVRTWHVPVDAAPQDEPVRLAPLTQRAPRSVAELRHSEARAPD